MNEEQAKAYLESMRARRGAPTRGPTPPPIAATDGFGGGQSAGGGNAPAQAPAAESETGGIAGWLMDKGSKMLGGVPQSGDLSEKLNPLEAQKSFGTGPLGYIMAAPSMAVGALETLENRDTRKGEIAPATTAVSSIMDSASLGSMNKLRGLLDAQAAVMSGEISDDQFGAALAEKTDEAALKEQMVSAANPMTAMGGNVIGSIAPGVGIAKLGIGAANKFAPKALKYLSSRWAGRAAAAGSAAAVESFLYRVNKDGDLERAKGDAAIGFLGGAALGSLFEGLGVAARKLKGTKLVDEIDEGVGREIIRMVNNDRALKGLPPATAMDVEKIITDMGPDTSLMDAFPSLKVLAKSVIKDDVGTGAADDLKALIATRNDLLEDVMSPDGTLRSALDAKSVRSPTKFFEDVKARFKSLGPQYDKLYKQYSGLSFDIKKMTADLDTMFGPDKSTWTQAQLETVEGIKDNIAYMVSSSAKKTKQGTVKSKVLTLQQVVDLKNQMQEAIGNKALRIARTDKTVPMDNRAVYNLSNIASYFTEKINVMAPDFRPVNSVYGNIAATKNAYTAGNEIMDVSGVDKAAFRAFVSNPMKTAAEKRAFVEGAKQNLFTQLTEAVKKNDGVKGIERVLTDNKPQLDRLRALLGDKAVDDMMIAVMPAVAKLRTATELGSIVPKVNKPKPPSPVIGELIDTLIAAGSPVGITSKAAGAGAVRRMAALSPAADELAGQQQLYGGILSKMGQSASSAYKGLEELMQRNIRPSQARGIAQGAAGGSALTGE